MSSTTPTSTRRKKPRHRAGPPIGPEVRFFAATNLEVRSAADGSDTIEVVGEPIVYDTPYKVRDLFGVFEETMAPGVASDCLEQGADVRFLFNHDGLPLARTLSGTLILTDGDKALASLAQLDARQALANDLAIAIERGDVSQMSCAFTVADDEWNEACDERRIKLFRDFIDVSAVTYPASPTTSIDVAQRMMLAAPVASRARIHKAWTVTRELREGRTVSRQSAELLSDALEALHSADVGATAPEVTDIPAAQEATATVDTTTDAGTAGEQDLDERGVPQTAIARREASLSFGDQRTIVYQALVEHLGPDAEDDDGYVDIYVLDLGSDWVVFESWCDNSELGLGMWRLAYALGDDDVVTFSGEPEKVNLITSYVPAEAADDSEEEADTEASGDEEPEATTTSSRALELELELLRSRRPQGARTA